MKGTCALAIAFLFLLAPRAIAAEPTGTLLCTVVAPDGSLVTSATVTATSDSGEPQRAMTDTSGTAFLIKLQPATYLVTATFSGYAEATANVTVTAGEQATVTLQFHNATPAPPSPSPSPASSHSPP